MLLIAFVPAKKSQSLSVKNQVGCCRGLDIPLYPEYGFPPQARVRDLPATNRIPQKKKTCWSTNTWVQVTIRCKTFRGGIPGKPESRK